MRKFIMLSFFTMSFYNVYWFYWNWRRQRELVDPTIRAGWRTFFSPVTAYLLFRDVHDDPRSDARWSPLLLAVTYLVLLLSFAAPGWWWLLTWISFAPLVPVQHSINRMHVRAGFSVDTHITARDAAVMAGGAIVIMLLMLLGRALDQAMLDSLILEMR
jgi:hypothetical protein